MYASQYGHVDLVELLLDLGHEEEVISVVNKLISAFIHNTIELMQPSR